MHDPHRILIVEDDANTARPLASLLRRRGFEVRTANSSRQVRAVLEEFTPEVALCDYALEGDDDGVFVARSLSKLVPGVRILFLSSHSPSHIRRQLGDLVVEGLLTKPASVNEILACLQNPKRD